ncbi:hypothetical protein-transmembrane prediction [Rhodopirellula baltica SH 1]|uniref:Uncharacterized protein n=1 Tax=Rhodopirellula baltica (strain DSM 10527 / NCIMB 13988 / SH1) TaxID=243090 RepID=Q7UJE1_RHOBA|nr:hypothetical protein-transmembrane prediction [Rhodopirellula baltica SH 1]
MAGQVQKESPMSETLIGLRSLVELNVHHGVQWNPDDGPRRSKTSVGRWQFVRFDFFAEGLAVFALLFSNLLEGGRDLSGSFFWMLFEVFLGEVLLVEQFVQGTSVLVTSFFLFWCTFNVAEIATGFASRFHEIGVGFFSDVVSFPLFAKFADGERWGGKAGSDAQNKSQAFHQAGSSSKDQVGFRREPTRPSTHH